MSFFESDGVKIYYEIEGTGPDLVLVHGFASNLEINWKNSGISGALKDENRVIMMDCRGHGKSDKPKDPDMYGERMPDDVINLMDYMGIEKANFMGYSMGSRILLDLLLKTPERFRSVILGGFVLHEPRSMDTGSEYEKKDRKPETGSETVISRESEAVRKRFQRFAQASGADVEALSAMTKARKTGRKDPAHNYETMLNKIKDISVPLMTVIGNEDFLPGDKTRMAMLVKNGCHFQIQGRDHLSVVLDRRYHMAVRAFLNFVNTSLS